MNRLCYGICVVVANWILTQAAFAQQDLINHKISVWFLEERFLIADRNEDALLDRNELAAFENEFIYYLTDQHYQKSDRNHDGFLSFNEMYDRTRSEFNFRFQYEWKQVRELIREYPELARPSLDFLKQRPALTMRLFANLAWLYEHEALVNRLYTDKAWLAAHPELRITLHNNLAWMASCPGHAKVLYKDRETTKLLPDLLGWRADHTQFIRKNALNDRFYKLEFLPVEIQVSTRK